MIFHVLAFDYDGTVADNGRMAEATVRVLEEVRESGRRLILVTGRILSELELVCPECERMFDAVVGENGGILYLPRDREVRKLGAAPEPELLVELRKRGVAFALGACSIQTAAAAAEQCLTAIRATGIDRTLVFNRDSLMLMPGGVAKRTGLEAALEMMGDSPHNTVGIGDGENDHAFLAVCEYAVAVGDAVPALRARADYVTRGSGPRGVVEFIREHLLKDMRTLVQEVPRHQIRVGETDGSPVTIPAHHANLLVVGPSRSGKSTFAGVLFERLLETRRSVCLLDPEGDFQSLGELRGVVALGGKGERTLPAAQEIAALLRSPTTSLVLNLSAMSRPEKVSYGTQILTIAAAARGSAGMPHWIMIDEAHHLMPAEGSPAADLLASVGEGICLITLEAKALPDTVLPLLNILTSPDLEAFRSGMQALRWNAGTGNGEASPLAPGEMVLARGGAASAPIRFYVDQRRSAHRRHLRKYAEGELPPDRSFYFRGPHGTLNLRAANLIRFCELAEGVDEATWDYHRRRGEYSTWIRDKIKDPELAEEAETLEKARNLSVGDSRRRLLQAVRHRYAV